MAVPQTGIFALGDLSHSYLDFDLASADEGLGLVTAVANLTEPRTTMGGVNLVAGFCPELWRARLHRGRHARSRVSRRPLWVPTAMPCRPLSTT